MNALLDSNPVLEQAEPLVRPEEIMRSYVLATPTNTPRRG